MRLLIFCFICVFGFASKAQNLNQIQRGQRGYTPPPLEQDEKKISVENSLADIDEKMARYQVVFALDAFELAVLKNIIVDFETQKMQLLGDETIEYSTKQTQIKQLESKLLQEVTVFLNEEEVKQFMLLHLNKDNKRKKKEKRKKKLNRNKGN